MIGRSRWVLLLGLATLAAGEFLACSRGGRSPAPSGGAGGTPAQLSGQTIHIARAIPYADPTLIQKSIIEECVELPERLSEFIASDAKAIGINVVRDGSDAPAVDGLVLDIKIATAVSSGNAFTGHTKQVSVAGRLLDGGREIANFTGIRSSGGGFGAGFKGSCAVLDRCVQTLGQDIAEWLKAPERGARLGE